jgi:hypothetical protein
MKKYLPTIMLGVLAMLLAACGAATPSNITVSSESVVYIDGVPAGTGVTYNTVGVNQANGGTVVTSQGEGVAPACGYDYSVMPTGFDEEGTPLADHGVPWPGSVAGPAMVQVNGGTAYAVYPGATYSGGGATLWKYVGDASCLERQFQWFPGKQILTIH